LKKRSIVASIVLLLTIVLVLPSLIVLPLNKEHASEAKQSQKTSSSGHKQIALSASVPVSVYRANAKSVDHMSLDDYLVGVVACEMPAEFEVEALKAQTLAARTYVINRLLNKPSQLPDGAEVMDTTADQVYKSRLELKQLWGKDYTWKIKRIEQAVTETEDQIMTYQGQIIQTPSFFSTSDGYTENAENYWVAKIPYLKSVPSPWDKTSPKYKKTTQLSVAKVEAQLGIQLPAQEGVLGKVTKWTTGKQVGEFLIAGKTFTGREVREKLGLPSADFSMSRKGNEVIITTKGFGHGVGMSQYGADGLAKEGKTYKQILQYYYTGVGISKVTPQMVSQMKKV
jgi:stage II sporulation protein D